MRCNVGCRFINGRVTAIGVGVISTLLWLVLVYISACDLPSIRRRWDYPSHHYMWMQITTITCFISTSASCAMSVLMVVGAVKRNANFMFPWLAIHFGLLLIAVAITFSAVVAVTLTERASAVFLTATIWFIGTCVLTFLWGVVYLHYTSLRTPMTPVDSQPKQPIVLNESNILKSSKHSDVPYYPV